jgi:hypothetical protein
MSTRLISNAFCVVAATATLGGYTAILYRSDWTTWGLTGALCAWAMPPYLVAIAINHVAVYSRGATLVALCMSLIVSIIGLFAIIVIYENAMLLIRDSNGMNCFGPILELGTPLAQFTLLVPGSLLVVGKKVLSMRGTVAASGHSNTALWAGVLVFLVFLGVVFSGLLIAYLVGSGGRLGSIVPYLAGGLVGSLLARWFIRIVPERSGRGVISRMPITILFGVGGGALWGVIGLGIGSVIGFAIGQTRAAHDWHRRWIRS